MLLGREPASFPQGLDPSLVDDRIVATAVDFKWRRRGAQVTVLSDDGSLLAKARDCNLDRKDMPERLRLRRETESMAPAAEHA